MPASIRNNCCSRCCAIFSYQLFFSMGTFGHVSKPLWFWVLIFCSTEMMAQQGSIKGKITGYVQGELPAVSLLSFKDSTLIKVAICDKEGGFVFDLLKPGIYYVTVSHIGYAASAFIKAEISVDKNDIILADIPLVKTTGDLQEVKVVARKSFVQQKIDRLVVNPDALISNAGTTALEVLEKSPGILVDAEGNISLKGKQGVLVFVDDKPTYIAGTDLAGYLRSIPSGSIETIEIMTNPPAKYDAAGNAGIVNIRLKKNTAKGLNGGVTLGYGQGRYLRTNNSVNFNYRVNQLNFFSTLGLSQNNSYQDLTINRYYFTPEGSYKSGFSQNSYIKRRYGGRTGKIGLDYYYNKKSTFGIVLSGFINPIDNSVTNNASILDEANNITTLVKAHNPVNYRWRNGSINVNYTYKIDSAGKELNINADYIAYRSRYEQTLWNDTYTPDNVLIQSSVLTSALPATITIQSFKADYLNPLNNKARLEAGFKTSFVSTDNTASFFDVENNVSTPNYEFSNRFKYKENINAAYFNYAKEWRSISLQLGLRAENTNIKGHQLGNPVIKDSAFTRYYTNLFPTAYFEYKADTLDKNKFILSAGRRINRPNYQDLNPFTYPMDRYTYYGGNPFLQPAFSCEFQLSHTYKNYLTTSISYNISQNVIEETNEQRGNIYYSRPGNFGHHVVYGIDVNGTFSLTKWWTLQLYTEYKNMNFRSRVYGQQLDDSRWYWYIGPNNQWVITQKLAAELSGSYQTRILVGQFLTIPVWQARAGVSYKILKGSGTVKLNVSDIFYTNQPGGDIRNIANSGANWLSYLDSRVATLSFSYRFNKGKSLNTRSSGASDAEKDRVKTT